MAEKVPSPAFCQRFMYHYLDDGLSRAANWRAGDLQVLIESSSVKRKLILATLPTDVVHEVPFWCHRWPGVREGKPSRAK